MFLWWGVDCKLKAVFLMVLLSRTYPPFYTDPDWRVLADGSFAVCLSTNVLFMVLSLDCGVSENLASVENVGL